MENLENSEIPIFRHLEDNDDLRENRDGLLVPGQESVANSLAKELFDEYLLEDCRAVFLICSSKKRSFETVEMISSELHEIKPDLKIRIVNDKLLREIDQGEIIIPDDYNTGEKFEGLQLAGRIFFKEVFAADKGGKDNLSYRYSDPLLQKDGTYKYPELLKYFTEPGESYKELLIRVYEDILTFSKDLDRFDEKTKCVICSHSQIIQIFKDLSEAATLIEKGDIDFKQGDLPRLCWELFKKRNDKKLSTGELDFVTVNPLLDTKVTEILKREVEFLKQLQ